MKRSVSISCFFSLLASALLFPLTAAAVDGALEINEACATNTGCFAGDAAGYPVSITKGGHYVLTSDLSPISSDAIQVHASGVTIDFDGSTIAYAGGGSSGSGVRAVGVVDDVAVHGGMIRNAPENGIALGNGARVEGMIIEQPGAVGISTAGSAIIRNNRVSAAGDDGIVTYDGATITDNVVYGSGQNPLDGDGGDGIQTRNHSVVRGNDVRSNSRRGIRVGNWAPGGQFGNETDAYGCLIEGNLAAGNIDGIHAGHTALVIDNVVFDNSGTGISTLTRASLRGNLASSNFWGFNLGAQTAYRESSITANAIGPIAGGGTAINRNDNYCSGTGTVSATCP